MKVKVLSLPRYQHCWQQAQRMRLEIYNKDGNKLDLKMAKVDGLHYFR